MGFYNINIENNKNDQKNCKNENKKVVFIIDHCELESCDPEEGKTIADLNRGFKTIFIYRLKNTNCKRLKCIQDQLSSKS